ncbi:hypothetical protein VTO42DRAFT_4342 [Malbranchea cinnamomea]
MGGRQRGSKGNRSAYSGRDGGRESFSMRDEALNTERHSLRRSSLRLRDNGIKFVSAGNMKPEDPALLNEPNDPDLKERAAQGEEKAAEDDEDDDEDHKMEEPSAEPDKDPAGQEATPMEVDEPLGESQEELQEEPLFFVDVVGDASLRPSPRPDPPKARPISPTFSDSSDDEVVFSGRGRSRPVVVIDDPAPAPTTFNLPKIKEEQPSPSEPPQDQEPSPPQNLGTPDVDRSSGPASPVTPEGFVRWRGSWRATRRGSKKRGLPRRISSEPEDDDEAVLRDYIENVMNHPSSDDDSPEPALGGQKSPTAEDIINSLVGNIGLSEPNGEAEDDDDVGDIELDSDLADEEDLQRTIDEDGMSVLAEHVHFSDILDTDDDVEEFDISTITAKATKYRRGNKAGRGRRSEFPSATAFADALDADPYGAFDIMDFDRPSLRKKPKGRRQIPELGLSDSELEWQLQATWENDRKKKKARKQQREELRAQGLLGGKRKKKAANDGPSIKIEDIIEEVREFLLSDSESLALPPMDKKFRKLVHELANKLYLNSVSKGSGAMRFPTLRKTPRTPDYDSDSIDRFDRLVATNRLLRRVEKSQRGGGNGGSAASKGRGGAKAASYRDGDVVGAWAPEIGADNKGRAMLEKMGWSAGMALGAGNNKGILQPVAHVVKTSKAGLG